MQRSKIPLSFDRQTYRCEQFIRGYNYSFFHIFCQKYTADAFQHYVYFQANIDQGKVSAPVDLPEILSLGFAQVNGFYLFANDVNLKNISSHVGSVYAYKISIEQPAAELVQVLDARYFQAAEPFSISHFEVMLNGDTSYQRFLAADLNMRLFLFDVQQSEQRELVFDNKTVRVIDVRGLLESNKMFFTQSSWLFESYTIAYIQELKNFKAEQYITLIQLSDTATYEIEMTILQDSPQKCSVAIYQAYNNYGDFKMQKFLKEANNLLAQVFYIHSASKSILALYDRDPHGFVREPASAYDFTLHPIRAAVEFSTGWLEDTEPTYKYTIYQDRNKVMRILLVDPKDMVVVEVTYKKYLRLKISSSAVPP